MDCLKLVFLDPHQYLNDEFLKLIESYPKPEQAELLNFLLKCLDLQTASALQIRSLYELYSKNKTFARILMSAKLESKFV